MRILLTATIILIYCTCYAQTASTLHNAGYKLNSISRADIGAGTSRNCHNVFIPFGTSQLLCAISTAKGEMPAAISLTAQVMDYYNTAGVPVFSQLLQGLQGASAQAAISMYVYTAPQCGQLFMARTARQCNAVDITNNTTGGIFYFSEPVLEFMRGKMCSFCIMNMENFSANYYNIELTAITE